MGSHSYLTITIKLSHPLTPHTIPTLPTLTPSHSPCPFTRLVYITSVDEPGLILIRRILDYVNESNAAALELNKLPHNMVSTALSTYKLTRSVRNVLLIRSNSENYDTHSALYCTLKSLFSKRWGGIFIGVCVCVCVCVGVCDGVQV